MDATRREVLSGSLASIGVLHGPPTLGGLSLGDAREEDLPRLFDRVDAAIDAFREATTPPHLVRWLNEQGRPEDIFHMLFGGLLVTSLVRDLPEALQASPVAQSRLEIWLSRIGEAAQELRALFASTPAAMRREIGRRYAEDPDLVARIKRAMAPYFGPDLVEPERQRQIERTLEQVTWELANGDPVQVFDEQIQRIDRFAVLSNEIIRRQASAEGHEGGSDGAPPDAPLILPGCDEILAEHDRLHEEDPPNKPKDLHKRAREQCRDEEGNWDARYRPIQLRRASRICAGIGAALAGLGTGLLTIPWIVGLCVLTPAGVLLIVALCLAIGSVVAENKLEQATP